MDRVLWVKSTSLNQALKAERSLCVSEVARWANEVTAKILPDDRPDEQIHWMRLSRLIWRRFFLPVSMGNK